MWNTGVRVGRRGVFSRSRGNPHFGWLFTCCLSYSGNSMQPSGPLKLTPTFEIPYRLKDLLFVWCFIWIRSGSPFFFYWREGRQLMAAEVKIKPIWVGRDFPVVRWIRLCAPNAGGLSSVPGQGTRSQMLQLKVPCAETKTWQNRAK